MAKPPLPQSALELIAKANPAVITTVRPDGQPVSVATWYVAENGQILVNMDAGRKRLDYLRHDPRVSLTILDSDDWYTHVSVQGTVTRLEDDTDLAGIDRIARHYTGQPYRTRDGKRVNAWIDIDQWHGWHAGTNIPVPG
ncbi:MAG: PPOX class F420-dependent oxidoreductase [Pseudonocardiales bacterium]